MFGIHTLLLKETASASKLVLNDPADRLFSTPESKKKGDKGVFVDPFFTFMVSRIYCNLKIHVSGITKKKKIHVSGI